MSPTLLTVAEVAERLRVSRATVYQLVERGLLRSHRVGAGRGVIRISETDLEDYLVASRRQREPDAAATPRRRLRHLRL